MMNEFDEHTDNDGGNLVDDDEDNVSDNKASQGGITNSPMQVPF